MSVDFAVKNRIATITLNRPQAMNSITEHMAEELYEALKRVERDNDIWAAILTGAGEKSFCTGTDLKRVAPPTESYGVGKLGNHHGKEFDHYHPKTYRDLPAMFMRLEKPLICAVNGYALGGGLEFALICDVRIAAEHAKFGLPEVKVGSIPGFGGTQRLPRVIGQSDAMLMLMTGDHIDAAEALRVGLVSRVVPKEKLQAEALAIASRMVANAPMSVRAVKRAARVGLELPIEHALEYENMMWGILRDTEDRFEGISAFAEKRLPIYRLR